MGDPVAHSLSPTIHQAAFEAMGIDWVSVGFHVTPPRLADAMRGMRGLDVAGMSVTMPHKSAVVAEMDELSSVAAKLGAVNCITNQAGRLVGDNTDGEGFLRALAEGTGMDIAGARCVVIGAGGAARAVILALGDVGAAEVAVVNRSADRAASAARLAGQAGRLGEPEDLYDADLVVQATPAGMAGVAGVSALPGIPLDALGPGKTVVDIVVNPPETELVLRARATGARAIGGLGMLVHQAAIAIERWTGTSPPVDAMWKAVDARGALGGDLR
jgi:shikimate dehydrogenase